jgi:hypothetical protein
MDQHAAMSFNPTRKLLESQADQLRECRERWKGVGFVDFAAMFANRRRSLVRTRRRDGGGSDFFKQKADDGKPSSAI